MLLFFLLVLTNLIEATATKELFVKYPNKYFVESGSYMGDGIQLALDAGFKNILSVELKESFYEENCRRFFSNPDVKLFLGDSKRLFPRMLEEIDAPATFWLDGHYSGGDTAKAESNTPLLVELILILNHSIKTHTILIDDIRLLNTAMMDFLTINQIVQLITLMNPNYIFQLEHGYLHGDVLAAFVPQKR